jgi:hypothetical protein
MSLFSIVQLIKLERYALLYFLASVCYQATQLHCNKKRKKKKPNKPPSDGWAVASCTVKNPL